MNFKVGDPVWFFWTDTGKYVFKEGGTAIYSDHFYIELGVIVGINEKRDYIHVYVDGSQDCCAFGYAFHEDYFYKTKTEAFEAIKKRIAKIEQEEY